MKKFTISLAAIVLLLAGISAYAQSLGDLAREEQKRRDEIKNDRVIIGNGVPTVAAIEEKEIKVENDPNNPASSENSKTGASAQSEDAENMEGSDDGTEKPDPNESTDLNGKTESYWRKTISDARAKVEELEAKEKELTSQRNDQQTRFNRADGVRRNGFQKEIQKTIYEQDQNTQELEKARNRLSSLRNEGQSSGALPGWLE